MPRDYRSPREENRRRPVSAKRNRARVNDSQWDYSAHQCASRSAQLPRPALPQFGNSAPRVEMQPTNTQYHEHQAARLGHS